SLFPHGAHVDAALRRATELAAYAADVACYNDSRSRAALVRRIRGSLAAVTATAKAPLIDALTRAARNCE
ncbi:MAG TPA: hypothetical protein VG106_09640, partial [Vicinamibacterales bacterium]|nr:hypothetical protein [Vicinamibacterales bacterium]